MRYQNNKELIIGITDRNRDKRIEKILGYIERPYILQRGLQSFGSTLTNIIIPARVKTDKVVLMAHHDVVPGSLGYNDNSTGVVTLLKLQHLVPDNVEIVFTDGEECGGQGCSMYLERCDWRPRMVFNVDVVGLGNTVFVERYSDPKGVINTAGTEMEYYKDIPFSDSRILERYGVPNLLLLTGSSSRKLITEIFNAQHNGPNDGRLDIISEETLDKVFRTLVTLIKTNTKGYKNDSSKEKAGSGPEKNKTYGV